MPLRAFVISVLLGWAAHLDVATAANRDISAEIDGLRGTVTSSEVYLVERGLLPNLLTSDYRNKNATGTFRLEGDSENAGAEIAVEATHRIEADLRIWAAQHESLKVQECPRPGT